MMVTNTLMLMALRKMLDSESQAKAIGTEEALNISHMNSAETEEPIAIRYFSRP